MKEIPLPYIHANQTGIVLLVLLALVTQNAAFIFLLWFIETIALLRGIKGNLFIQMAKPLLSKQIIHAKTESLELSRFNQILAVLFLTISILLFLFHLSTAGFIISALLATVALAALSGYCFGCTLYYWYKLLMKKHKQ